MNHICKTLAFCLALLVVFPVAAKAQDDSYFASEKERVSYYIGWRMASQNLLARNRGLDIDFEALRLGVEDGYDNVSTDVVASRLGDSSEFTGIERALEDGTYASIAPRDAREHARAFLERNKLRPGVVTTRSGMQYLAREEGSGPRPTASDTVTAYYWARLLDGTLVVNRRNGDQLQIGRLIPGMKEALKLMNSGSSGTFFIPPELAYGELGVPDLIGPDELVTFHIDLESID